MKIINLTPHIVVLRAADGTEVSIAPTAPPARVATKSVATGETVGGLPVFRTIYGEIENLPASDGETKYIVSVLVLGRCRGRDYVFAPGTGPQDGAVRDEQGRVAAVTRLIAADETPSLSPSGRTEEEWREEMRHWKGKM